MTVLVRRVVACLGLSALLASSLLAGPVPALDVTELTVKADVIAIGRVVSVTPIGLEPLATSRGQVPIRLLRGELVVDDILKGSAPDSALWFEFKEPHAPDTGYGSVDVSNYLMLFLRRDGSRYVFASQYSPGLAVTPDVTVAGDTPIERVGSALAAALGSPAASRTAKLDLLWALSTTRSQSAHEGLRTMLGGPDRDLELRAAGILVQMNDAAGLPIVEDALLHPARERPESLAALRGCFSFKFKMSQAIPSLSRLLSAGEVETRRAAAEGLFRTGSPRAVQPLAQALNDDDAEVEFWATVGLAETVAGQQSHRTLPGSFTGAKRDELLAYWKTWAREHGLIK